MRKLFFYLKLQTFLKKRNYELPSQTYQALIGESDALGLGKVKD